MRTLTETLEAAQKAASIDALVKIALTHGEDSCTYTRDRILDIKHTEEPYTQRVKMVLDNSDGALTSLDLKGFKAVISYGAVTGSGEEYSACAPLWVIGQQFESSPGKLDCALELAGIPNLMAEDKAGTSYIPGSADIKTVKTLLGEILGATLACFNHCAAYEVVWDSEDSLINSFKPKDSFRIYVGGSRLAAIRRLLSYTRCVMRAGADGSVHIFEPVITGETYDYEYSLESGHTFFSKAYRKRLVIPNCIVVKSQPDDDPQYSGYAQDAESYALLPKRDYEQMRLESDAQATLVAEAILAGHRLWSEAGAASVPLNTGAEVFDYVKVTDEREADYRTGTIGHLTRHWNARRAEWRMTFNFGSWTNVRKVLTGLGLSSADELEEYFTRLKVKDLYAENIQAENMDFIWLDPDNTINLSKIGDNLDNLPDGELYARVKSLHLDAGQVKLDENIFYSPGYNPTSKFDLAGNDLDDIPEGATYRRTKSSALTADGLIVLDQVYIDTESGQYGLVNRTDISAGHIKLSEVVESDIYKKYTSTEQGKLTGIEDGADVTGDHSCSDPWSGHTQDDLGDGTAYGRILASALSSGQALLSQAVGNLDNIGDGASYGRVNVADLSGGHIKLVSCEGNLDNIADGSSYGKIALTDISAGHILLASAVEDATYKKYTSTEQGKLGGVEEGAEVTTGKSLTLLIDRVADNIAEGATKKWAAETGADVTTGKSLSVLIDRVASNISETDVLKWAAESGADVTTGHQGDISLANLGEKSLNSLTDRIADYIAETATKKWAAETGADVTTGKSLSVLINRTADQIAETAVKKWAAESGADVTGSHQSATVASLSGHDLDDLPNGTTYQRVKATDISSGHIKLTSNIVVDGHWYNVGGVDIDATAGVTITGGKLTLKDSGGAHSAQLYVDTGGHLRLDMWDYVETQSIVSKNDGSWTLGASSRRFHSAYAKYFFPSTDGGFIFLTSAAGTEGSIKIKGSGSGDIYIYSSGAWRTNT